MVKQTVVTLLRHARVARAEAGIPDRERKLNALGREQTEKMRRFFPESETVDATFVMDTVFGKETLARVLNGRAVPTHTLGELYLPEDEDGAALRAMLVKHPSGSLAKYRQCEGGEALSRYAKSASDAITRSFGEGSAWNKNVVIVGLPFLTAVAAYALRNYEYDTAALVCARLGECEALRIVATFDDEGKFLTAVHHLTPD